MKTQILKLALVAIMILSLKAEGQTKFKPEYGKDSVNCITNLSLYREFYRQKNYKDAYVPWQWVYCNCPKSSLNVMPNGAVIINTEIQNTKDQNRRKILIDSLFIVYDYRQEIFPDEKGMILGRAAIDYIKLVPQIWDAKLKAEKDTIKKLILIDSIASVWTKAYNMFSKSIEIEGNKTSPSVVDAFYQTAEKYMKALKLDKDIMFDAYDIGSDIIEFNLSQSQTQYGLLLQNIDTLKYKFSKNEIAESDYKKQYSKMVEDSLKLDKDISNFEKARGNFEIKFTPYANCEDISKIYTKKFNSNPTDVSLLNKITKVLNKKGCTSSKLFFDATEKLHSIQPTAQSAFMMGIMNYKKNDYNKSKEYLEEAVKLFTEDNDKAKCYLILASVCMASKQYALGRSYAYKYAALKPGDGYPYILIGDMYMASASGCGTDELTRGAVYWAAADKYMRAKSIDKTREAEANKRYSQAAARFPKKETLFFNNLTKGQAYTVGCWIGETTTVK